MSAARTTPTGRCRRRLRIAQQMENSFSTLDIAAAGTRTSRVSSHRASPVPTHTPAGSPERRQRGRPAGG